jgi:tetratricopeptide (TPR) repeat protein
MQAQRLQRLPSHYADNVRDIHAMDVRLGRWVRENVAAGARVAVNDIGAIAYFGERRIVDAIGLATPELTPYWSPRRVRTLMALRALRPELCIIFPTWFPEWVNRPSLLEPLHQIYVDDITILGGAEAVVFRCHWDLFARYYDNALLERLDPEDAYDSLHGHLRRGLRNLQLPTRAFLHARAGDAARQRHDKTGAARHYRRAVDLDPQEVRGWKGLLELAREDGGEAEVGRLLGEFVQHMPNSAPALEAHADWQARQGDADAAARSYDAALALHPDNTRLLGKMEKFWNARGRPERASALLARRRQFEWPPPRGLPPP